MLKKTTVAAAALCTALAFAAAPAAALTKEDVQKIVHDYIMENPGVIMESVQSYQERSVAEQQRAALEVNRQDIYNDIDTPFAGNEKGDVTVVEFFDYNCGYCKKVWPDIARVLEDDKNVRILFKEFPILGPTSESAAKWALAAHRQGKYLEYHQALMDSRSPITDSLLEKTAKAVGLDVAKAKKDAAGTEILVQIQRNRTLAENMDISGTPAFIVGDDLAPGAISADKMKAMIRDVRAKRAEKK